MTIIIANNEFDGYYHLLKTIKTSGIKYNRFNEIHNSILCIGYKEDSFKRFKRFKNKYIDLVGSTAISCWNRAIRVYTTTNERMTKPSYYNRLHSYPDIKYERIDQIENIIWSLAEKPGYSILSFTIFSPKDLYDMKRPGYVPCPISGDFKFREGKLQLNIFFRSHDALNFGYADIYYFRKLQIEVLSKAKKITKSKVLQNGNIGTLNFHFSRAYIPLRMEMPKQNYINKKEIDHIINNLSKALEKNM